MVVVIKSIFVLKRDKCYVSLMLRSTLLTIIYSTSSKIGKLAFNISENSKMQELRS